MFESYLDGECLDFCGKNATILGIKKSSVYMIIDLLKVEVWWWIISKVKYFRFDLNQCWLNHVRLLVFVVFSPCGFLFVFYKCADP